MLAEFIREHSGDDTARLLLSKDKWPEIDMNMAVTAIECRRKIVNKLPEWYSQLELVYPDRICAEQSSSSFTARYKASVARRIILSEKAMPYAGRNGAETSLYESMDGRLGFGGNRTSDGQLFIPQQDNMEKSGKIADLTGGLGADSLAFSKIASQVIYNEMSEKRAQAAMHNFNILKADNIRVTNYCVTRDSEDFWDELRTFSPDLVYLDPARRSETGKKVFLLEECSPDILSFIPKIFDYTRNLMLKLSPMADISMVIKRLALHGARTLEMHVVAAEGECKELLLWLVPFGNLSKDEVMSSGYELYINESGHILSLRTEESGMPISSDGNPAKNLSAAYLDDEQSLMRMKHMFEPGKAMSKAGIFNQVCSIFIPSSDEVKGSGAFYKAAPSTHLYFTDENLLDCAQEEPAKDGPARKRLLPSDFGKIYEILDILPFNKQSIKDFSKRFPHSEVSARNLKITSDELRSRLHAKGGDIHIFGIRIDFNAGKTCNYLIAARPESNHPQ